jgi:hypothetical protein
MLKPKGVEFDPTTDIVFVASSARTHAATVKSPTMTPGEIDKESFEPSNTTAPPAAPIAPAVGHAAPLHVAVRDGFTPE